MDLIPKENISANSVNALLLDIWAPLALPIVQSLEKALKHQVLCFSLIMQLQLKTDMQISIVTSTIHQMVGRVLFFPLLMGSKWPLRLAKNEDLIINDLLIFNERFYDITSN